MIFYNTIGHIEIIEEKDLVHIVKSIWRYFYSSEIIPIFGIILCVLSLFIYFQNYCVLCGEKHINNNDWLHSNEETSRLVYKETD